MTTNYNHPARSPKDVPCPHFPRCFGCPLISVPYPEQLERKQNLVREALCAHPQLSTLDVPTVTPSPRRLGYRGRVKLVVGRNRDEVAIGLYVPHSHRLVDISSCPVHPLPVNQVVGYLKRKLHELSIAPYDERDDSGDLRYVDLRYSFSRRELMLTLVTRHASLPQGEKLARALQRKFSFVTGVVQNVNESRGNVIWGERYRMLAGRDTLLENVAGLKIAFPISVFSQANPATAQKLYQSLVSMAALNGKENVLDLYCGVGPISLLLAGGARQVWAIDESSEAINAAKQNARRNGVGNCRFIAGDVAEKIRETTRGLPQIDCIVANPPRKGVQPAALEALIELGAPRIIYVSCRPQSLARDLEHLVESGYQIARLQPFDMFPQTAEVETLVLLERNS